MCAKKKKKGIAPTMGRLNGEECYKDRDPMNGEQEYMGEDIGGMGIGKGSERKRLANEIDDNLYEPQTEIRIIDDPRDWGEETTIALADVVSENYQKSLKKYLRIIRKTYDWLRDSENGREINSMPSLRAAIGMTRNVWETAERNSEEFKYYSELIHDILGSRVSDSGMSDNKGTIFKIFTMKNLLPDEYQDKKETSHFERVEVIKIGGVDDKALEEDIKKNKKRLNK